MSQMQVWGIGPWGPEAAPCTAPVPARTRVHEKFDRRKFPSGEHEEWTCLECGLRHTFRVAIKVGK